MSTAWYNVPKYHKIPIFIPVPYFLSRFLFQSNNHHMFCFCTDIYHINIREHSNLLDNPRRTSTSTFSYFINLIRWIPEYVCVMFKVAFCITHRCQHHISIMKLQLSKQKIYRTKRRMICAIRLRLLCDIISFQHEF